MKSSVSPLHSLSHTHTCKAFFVFLSFIADSTIAMTALCLSIFPTVLSQPKTEQVLLLFGASDRRLNGSFKGKVSRVVAAIS